MIKESSLVITDIKESELIYLPNTKVEVENEETLGKVYRLLETLEDLDDVVATHTNLA